MAAYRQFETLLPNNKTAGAAHRGEDGRFVEDLLRSYLRKYLPQDLEVLTGFILRPAVKTGTGTRTRADHYDGHSTQLDIIIYDTANYPVFQRFSDSVIVPPEGVVAIISVKKTLNDQDIDTEAKVLHNASELCRSDVFADEEKARGPFLALVGTQCSIDKKDPPTPDWIFNKLVSTYARDVRFDDLIGLVSDLSDWSIFKARPEVKLQAKYLYFKHAANERHLGFQFLISGILSVYYDKTRQRRERPGFTAFPNRKASKSLGIIPYQKLR
ncbi:DUF6602 domain-containing protein [Rhizobium ruizarguesonis]|jgi:hypothetical protein|uniref:DUF6602 domain-containing protein n=1 Tax=Rhizobium ruizarguesonis TaxID=2081791 RepID=UPI00195489D0|nr:DUF6602 domain-containing protein [Rhizobium ruizarguesonis]